MRQYTTIAQTLLVLSILNHVIAAPAIPRDAGSDVAAVAEDVATMSERRRGLSPPGPGGTTGTTPSQFTPSLPDGPPPHVSSPLDESALPEGSESSNEWAPSSATDGPPVRTPTSTHPLSAAAGPGPYSTTEASTSARPLSEAGGSAPVPGSNTEASTSSHQPGPVHGPAAEGRITSQYTAITPNMLYKDPNHVPTKNKILGLGLVAATVAAVVFISAYHHHSTHHNSTRTGG